MTIDGTMIGVLETELAFAGYYAGRAGPDYREAHRLLDNVEAGVGALSPEKISQYVQLRGVLASEGRQREKKTADMALSYGQPRLAAEALGMAGQYRYADVRARAFAAALQTRTGG